MNLNKRPRRLRRTNFGRRLTRESLLTVDDLIQPAFVRSDSTQDIPSMPGIEGMEVDVLVDYAASLYALGIPCIALFPVIEDSLKDPTGAEALNPDGLIPRAIAALKQSTPQLGVISDVALDPYTSHGQDGVTDESGDVLNDETVNLLVQQALCHARAGVDMVAPSDMMDGRVRAIRQALEKQNFVNTQILSYSAKYCSALYSPFREAVGSQKNLEKKVKCSYQMDVANSDEALREVALDLEEGADIVMIKPGLPYLDIVTRVKTAFRCPVFSYHVSGEYAMLKAAAANGWIDEESCVIELLTCCRRAGADAILTYYARECAEWLRKGS